MEEKLPRVGPQPISIEDYKKRTSTKKIPVEIIIPRIKPPKRRGGYLVKKRRELANLKRLVNSSPPPPWNLSVQYWKRIDEIQNEIKTHLIINKSRNN